MSRAKVWYGYLEAGQKSTPVVRDPSLDTGNAKMIYLYNFSRNAFLEYAAAVVEPKLRELNGDEADMLEQLKRAYAEARDQFQGRSHRSAGALNGHTPAAASHGFLDRAVEDDESTPFLDDSDGWDDD